MKHILDDKQMDEIIQSLKRRLRRKKLSSKKDVSLVMPRFVFVCGKSLKEKGETIRNLTQERFKKFTKQNEYQRDALRVLCIISEDIYIQDLSEDLFSFEALLAEISNKIIIVAESAGTYCELGAFTMDKECMKKMIVINEDREEYQDSFITKGPIKMLKNYDVNSVILHNGSIKGNMQYEDIIKKIAEEEISVPINHDHSNIEIRSLIYELANVIELFQPLSAYEIEVFYKKIKDFENYSICNYSNHKIRTIEHVLILMEKMGLINKDSESRKYIINPDISCYNVLFMFSRKEFLDFRIKYLNRFAK